MRPLIEVGYLFVAVWLIGSSLSSISDNANPQLGVEGALVAQEAIDTYSSLLGRVATEAANALEAGQITTDRELLSFLKERRQAAADAAFALLHIHQQQRIGVQPGEEFSADKAAQLMREYAEGWRR